jgi:hypothetical protein
MLRIAPRKSGKATFSASRGGERQEKKSTATDFNPKI